MVVVAVVLKLNAPAAAHMLLQHRPQHCLW
jgi:hypothetical protein